jgi:hypothetical protein
MANLRESSKKSYGSESATFSMMMMMMMMMSLETEILDFLLCTILYTADFRKTLYMTNNINALRN